MTLNLSVLALILIGSLYGDASTRDSDEGEVESASAHVNDEAIGSQ